MNTPSNISVSIFLFRSQTASNPLWFRRVIWRSSSLVSKKTLRKEEEKDGKKEQQTGYQRIGIWTLQQKGLIWSKTYPQNTINEVTNKKIDWEINPFPIFE